jgi:hypothetical protein
MGFSDSYDGEKGLFTYDMVKSTDTAFHQGGRSSGRPGKSPDLPKHLSPSTGPIIMGMAIMIRSGYSLDNMKSGPVGNFF